MLLKKKEQRTVPENYSDRSINRSGTTGRGHMNNYIQVCSFLLIKVEKAK